MHGVVHLPTAAMAAGGVGCDVGLLHERMAVDRLLGVDGDADIDAQRQEHALGLEGGSKPAMRRRAAATTSSVSATPGRTTANCSLPRRPNVADSGSRLRIRPLAWTSRPSALWWPNASTTWVNESRSITINPTRPRSVYAAWSATSSVPLSRAWLGSPVSGSWRAWWARSAASRSRTMNSSPFSMAIDA